MDVMADIWSACAWEDAGAAISMFPAIFSADVEVFLVEEGSVTEELVTGSVTVSVNG